MAATWAAQSRKVIDRVLTALPVDTTEKDARKALRDAYPFGIREHHPYKVWCQIVREMLKARFGKRDRANLDARIVFRNLHGADGKRIDWWLDVRCPHCDTKRPAPRGGCLLCASRHEAVARLVDSDEWRLRWKPALVADPDVAPILADWLDDHDEPELAALFRAARVPEGVRTT